ncbi:MAG: AI-2E family transporter [bacterium]
MNSTQPPTTSQYFAIGIGALLLVALLYTVNAILSPFVVTGAILFLLYPYRSTPLARRLMWLSVMLFACWFLYSLLSLLVPFLLAFLFAYLLNPLVTRMEKRKVPRWLGSGIAVLLLLLVVVTAGLFIGPVAFEQFQSIIAGVAHITRGTVDFFSSGDVYDVLARIGIPMHEAQQFVLTQISPRLEFILKSLFEGILGFFMGFSSLIVHILTAIIIPFLIYYLLNDFHAIRTRVALFVPAQRREKFLASVRRSDAILGKYFRGAIIVALIQGTVAAIGLSIIGVDYALILGIMTGILDFIPYLGLVTSLVVASLVAAFSGEPTSTKVIAVIVLFLVMKLVEGTVLAPRIIGSGIGLHPVLLILCLTVFGYFLGFMGLLIAVPATALMVAAFAEWERRRDFPVLRERE